MPPGMPPANESGSPMLPMFGAEISELFVQALNTNASVVTLSSALRDGVNMTAQGIFGETSNAMVGTQIFTSRGVLRADMVSQGVLQAALEGFAPLPFLNFSTQLAFVPAGLAGGMLQSMLMTPVGMLMGNVNTGGQLSCEFLTGAQPSPTSQLMLGTHVWGLPGLLGGYKAALEWQHAKLDAEENLIGSSAITLACTMPLVEADGTRLDKASRDPSLSLSVFQRTSEKNSMAVSLERTPNAGIVLTAGGTRQLTDRTRLRGKWGTSNVLALALEVAADKGTFTLVSEMNTAGAPAPKFSAMLNLNLAASSSAAASPPPKD